MDPTGTGQGRDLNPAEAALPAIAGIDSRGPLKNLGGRVSVYRRLLAQFAQHGQRMRPELEALPASSGIAAIRHAAHSLRGAAAAIGAFELVALAQKVEAQAQQVGAQAEPGAQGTADATGLPAAVHALLQGLDGLLQGIELALASPAVADVPPAQPAQPVVSVKDRDRLMRMLASGDYAAVAEARRLTQALQPQHPQAAREIDAAMAAFDFERALSTLRRLQF